MSHTSLLVYAGTFDPLTNGHLWMIKAGLRLADHLVIAIGVNPAKKHLIPLERRESLLRMVIDNIHVAAGGLLSVAHFSNQYLVDYAREIGASHILRGIRNIDDYRFERSMRHINQNFISPGIETIFLMPPDELCEISSSMVKGLVGPAGWENVVEKMVPGPVFEYLKWDYHLRLRQAESQREIEAQTKEVWPRVSWNKDETEAGKGIS